MNKYNEDAPCPKCGSTKIKTWFVTDADRWSTGYQDRHNIGDIRRTCGRCNYHWYEAPLDKEDENETLDHLLRGKQND